MLDQESKSAHPGAAPQSSLARLASSPSGQLGSAPKVEKRDAAIRPPCWYLDARLGAQKRWTRWGVEGLERWRGGKEGGGDPILASVLNPLEDLRENNSSRTSGSRRGGGSNGYPA